MNQYYLDDNPKQPYTIQVVDKLWPSWLYKNMGAKTHFNKIYVKSELIGNTSYGAMIAHELEHVRQWYREGWLFVLKYIFSAKHRMHYEIQGYVAQIMASPRENHCFLAQYFAKLLHKNYYLGYDEGYVMDALSEAYDIAVSDMVSR